MYFELKAKDAVTFQHSMWDAEMMGLDPEIVDQKLLTFNIGTGSIEKVSSIRDKHGLVEVYVSESEPYHPY